MSLDDKLRSGSLETYTALDADNGVAHVAVAADGIRGSYFFYLLDGSNLVVEFLVVDSYNLTLLEGNL